MRLDVPQVWKVDRRAVCEIYAAVSQESVAGGVRVKRRVKARLHPDRNRSELFDEAIPLW